jgi:hypothetical protein
MSRWEGNIKFHPNDTGCEGVNLIHLAQHRDQRKARIYLTVYNPFNEGVCSSVDIVLNGRMIRE